MKGIQEIQEIKISNKNKQNRKLKYLKYKNRNKFQNKILYKYTNFNLINNLMILI